MAGKLTEQMAVRFTKEERRELERIARRDDRKPSAVIRRMVQAQLRAEPFEVAAKMSKKIETKK